MKYLNAPFAIMTVMAAVTIGCLLGISLMLRVEQINSQVLLLTEQITQTTPRMVLCTLAAQMQMLHATMDAHCQERHGAALLKMPYPTICNRSTDWITNVPNPDGTAEKGQKE